MNIPSFEETYRITSEKHRTNVEKNVNNLRDMVAHRISACSVIGKFHCTLGFYNEEPQDEAFHEAVDIVGDELTDMGYEVLFTHSGDEANDTFHCDEIRISWYVEL